MKTKKKGGDSKSPCFLNDQILTSGKKLNKPK